MVSRSVPQPASRDFLRERFEADRPVHLYGLGDLTDAYFSRSRWWRQGSATIGEVGLPGDPPDLIVYGINAGDRSDALELWVGIDHLLPDRYFATGPVGFPDDLATRGRRVEFDAGEHVKMFLKNVSKSREIASRATQTVDEERGFLGRSIDRGDLAAIETLLATRHDPGSFFTPTLLDDGPFYGVFDGDELIAMAGVHICSTEMDVAAIGCVLVHADRRGHGLGTLVTAATVCALDDLGIGSIGLNVKADNASARHIYEGLGFEEVHRYHEALMVRDDTSSFTDS